MLILTVEEPLPLLIQKDAREGRGNQNLKEEEHVEQTDCFKRPWPTKGQSEPEVTAQEVSQG